MKVLLVISLMALVLTTGAALFGSKSFPFLGRGYFGSSITKRKDIDGRLLGHFPYKEALKEDLVLVSPGHEVHRDAAKSLLKMTSAAAAVGIDLRLLSGYRSHGLQKRIFFEIKSIRNQTASERSRVSAPPGHSEHSTGYAIDLGDGERPETDLSVEFETTRTFAWLQRNAARYHFTLSFPRNNQQGVTYEPWHWRFEGTADALRKFEAANNFLRQKQNIR